VRRARVLRAAKACFGLSVVQYVENILR